MQDGLPQPVHLQIIELVTMILEELTDNCLQELFLPELCCQRDAALTDSEEEKRLINALLNAN